MAILPIVLIPDPVLRVECPEVTTFDDDLRRLVDNMVETMYAAPGVGLAAPQVGIKKRLAVVDVTVGKEDDALKVLINPRIVEEEGKVVDYEGCLSIPDISEKVSRPRRIRVEAQDVSGEPFSFETEDFEARAVCHELDHLNGVLFIDHLRGLRKEKVKRQIRKRGLVWDRRLVRDFRDLPDTRAQGRLGEEEAEKWMIARGYRILERNFQCKSGEIDRIAELDGVLCFVEIKARANRAYGSAIEAVSTKKQRRIARAASVYLAKNPTDMPCRFDVLAMDLEQGRWLFTWVADAFSL